MKAEVPSPSPSAGPRPRRTPHTARTKTQQAQVRAGTARRSKRYLPSRRHPTTAGRTALRKKVSTCAIGDWSKSALSARACAIHAGRRHRPSSGERRRAAAGRTVMCGEVLEHVRIEVVVAAPADGRAPALVHARSAATRPNDSKRGLSRPATARDPAGPRLACAARALRSAAVRANGYVTSADAVLLCFVSCVAHVGSHVVLK